MATESPMRMMESSGARNWPSSNNPSLNNMAAEELRLLLKGHRLHGYQRSTVPNRSGSAPPSMEGSFTAFGNLIAQHSSGLSSTLASFSSSTKKFESEEQLRADPAYFTYYYSNVNLNPRLPPPIISRENRCLVSHVVGLGNNWRLTSSDDSGNGSLCFPRGSLSTHNEEPEDDRLPCQASDNFSGSTNAFMSVPNAASSTACHKSLVNLIQEDFPCTPSPVYNRSHLSSHSTSEELINHDIQAISFDNLSLDISKLSDSKSGPVDVCEDMNSENANDHGLTLNDNAPVISLPKKSYPDAIVHVAPPQTVELIKKDAGPVDKMLVSGATRSDTFSLQGQKYHQNNVLLQRPQPLSQRGGNYQVRGTQPQFISQGMNLSHNGMEISHGRPKISSAELSPVVQPPGLTPPLYTTAASYMTPGNQFYPGLHPSGLYSPQYGMGGYALSSAFLPPFIAGYPPHTGIPMQFDTASGQSFIGRTAAVSTGEGIPHTGDLQNIQKFYGQSGLLLQPSFSDPHQMQYFQHPAEDAYGASGQYGWLTSMGAPGGRVDSFASQKEAMAAAYRGDQKFQPSPDRNQSIVSPRKGGITSSSYYESPPRMGVMTQFPASPLGSPLLPGSPVGGANHSGRRNELRFSQGSCRNVGYCSGWQGNRGGDTSGDPKKHSFLEELKSSNAHKIDLSDMVGRIVEFSVDQHGSRFIQQKLENCGVEEKASVFKEVLPHASKLMTDVFGNYVIQKFFEHGSREQRKELADQLLGQMLPLSLQMYGCRVIQKALEVIELDQKIQLVHELDGHVMKCVRDQNANHVIQKCIECVPTAKIGFIISAFKNHVAMLSTHPYGCRVIQRVLEHCSDDLQCIVDEILESAYVLAQDQYGNYVTQHVLERGKPHERSKIISKLTGKIVQMSQHKYASNVVEKCLEHGDAAEQEFLIDEILGQSEENDNLVTMMKDQFANYVIQRILETSNDKQREVLLNRIRIHLHALKKYTYGKHIVARFEQLSAEESESLEK
ncbi:pumilio homolog 5-like isoform X1 [Actinidia eriantha]|uniref:pumilio homolog 5-like isoform X1 n=1 Tax=Actinidia eriantha TaxID=165200 RepID=UPI00258F526E|nr:pumilio homolog 5-like isoform X1 [Actinidia eriantha]XP_057514711.1 pumilio homolog 5-like isoform X1 [Actinidia eriantha]